MAVKESNDFDRDSSEDKNETFPKSGTITKVLHSFVETESLLNKSAKMLDRPATKSTSSDSESYSRFRREYAILSEFNFVAERRIPGMYVIPSAKSELVWFGVLFVRSGIYKGGVFRFVLYIPDNYPNCSHPRLFFESNVFHPSVASDTYELNLKSVFSHWTKGVNFIWQILDFTKSIFYQIPMKSTMNKTASQLYETNREEFMKRVRNTVEQSQKDIYDTRTELRDDIHYLKFGEFNEKVHSEAFKMLKLPKIKGVPPEGAKLGLSWVKRGSFKPCSTSPYF